MKIIRIVLALTMVALLAGCRGEGFDTQNGNSAENHFVYNKSNTELGFELETANEYSIRGTLRNCYYIYEDAQEEKTIHNGAETITEDKQFLRKKSFESGVESDIYSGNEGEILSYFVDEREEADYIYLLTYEESVYRITQIDEDGAVVEKEEIDFDGVNVFPFEMFKNNEYYYFLTSKSLIISDLKGQVLSIIECPGTYYNSICKCSETEVLVSYSDNEKSEEHIVRMEGKKEKSNITVPILCRYMFFTGKGVSILSKSELYMYVTKEDRISKIYDLSIDEIKYTNLRAVFGTDDELIFVLKDKTGLQAVVYSKSVKEKNSVDGEEYDNLGRKIIQIYAPNDTGVDYSLIENHIIEKFNEDSKDYCAQIVKNEEKFEVTFIQDTRPDVFFLSNDYNAYDYIDNGYLERLDKYIDSDEDIIRDRLNKLVYKYFCKDGLLYAIPRSFRYDGIIVKKSCGLAEIESDAFSFFDWIESNQPIYSVAGLDQYRLLRICLQCGIHDYVDFENGEVTFDDGRFARLISRIKDFEIETNQENEYIILGLDDIPNGEYLADYSWDNVLSLASAEFYFGDELYLYGYPQGDNQRHVSATPVDIFGIYSNSDCKEGAFEFIKYCLEFGDHSFYDDYHSGELVESEDYRASGIVWSLDALRDKEFNLALGKRSYEIDKKEIFYEVERKHAELLIEISECATICGRDWYDVQSIIYEEIGPFFNGEKTADEVSKVIQSRVSILISERK